MARVCTVCSHQQRAAIDSALVSGQTLSALSRAYRVSEDALGRHRDRHVPAKIVKAAAAVEVAEADDLVTKLAEYEKWLRSLAAKGNRQGDLRVSVQAVRELLHLCELVGKIRGQLSDQPQVNIFVGPAWLQVRQELLIALVDHPQARDAVLGRLAALEAVK